MQLPVPIRSRQEVWNNQRFAGPDAVIARDQESLQRLTELRCRGTAGNQHRARSGREEILITDERDQNALKARKIGNSEEPCLSRSDHLACGYWDTESISPRALVNNIIAPAAAADASQATAMSPDLTASCRTSTAFAASLTALMRSA